MVSEVALTAVPAGVTILIVPVVAVAGNVAVICVGLLTTNAALILFILTEVAPVR